ncbi:hypothetical protein P9B03_08430 [Metasolibacillus meyeri]|uniref:Uncharacterized protein n=1 Tax=Metasolibacillus meyeri TaxID=1071052 RepID=A0AAW9NIL6_9BACL|nr:hypothetical protein [Metasolibacillus meyeri]MEC1178504.1 hypothetical protein [Metasolibacillus meyeri]
MQYLKNSFYLPKIYRFMFIPIFLIAIYYELFINWQVQYYYFDNLGQFGTYIAVSLIAFLDAVIIIYILYSIQWAFSKWVLKK